MSFGVAGAAAGASEALIADLVQKRRDMIAQQELALRQQESARQDADLSARLADREDTKKNRKAQIALTAIRPGAISEAEAAPIRGTDYESMLSTQQTLPSTSRVGDLASGTMASTQDAGGQDFSVLKPTLAQEQAAGQQAGQRRLVELFKKGAPRNELAGALVDAGENVPAALLGEDPAAADARRQADAVALEHVRGDETRRTNAARPPAESTAVEWVTRNGHPVQIRKGTAQPGDVPYEPTQTRRPIGIERSALAFYNRGKQASDEIANSGYEEQYAKANLLTQAQGSMPNILQTDAQQKYRQAQRTFTEARLRKESGAAVPQSEYDNDARTYFAVPGDSTQVIAQKRAMRQGVLDGLAFQAGPAYEEYYGEPLKPNAAGVQGATPQVGDVKTFPNSKRGQWDGKGWVMIP